MKVLFAVSNESISEGIVKQYQRDYKEILSYKNVYYFNAILKEIQRDKTYDRIVISEELEPFASNNYEAIDKFLFEKLDNISDEAQDSNGQETSIIFICTDRRTKGSSFLVKLFSIGIYNALLGNDRVKSEVCRLINKPRIKKEAKMYYKIDAEDAKYDQSNEKEVSELEIQNILSHFKKLGKNTDKYADSFNNIAMQYTDDQLKIVINCLPMNVKAVLEAESPKYQEMMSVNGGIRGNNVKALKKDEEKPGIRVGFINSASNKIDKPIIIPSSVKKVNLNNKKTMNVAPTKNTQIKREPELDDDIIDEDDFIDTNKSTQVQESPMPRKVVTHTNPQEVRKVVQKPVNNENKVNNIQSQNIVNKKNINVVSSNIQKNIPKQPEVEEDNFLPDVDEEIEDDVILSENDTLNDAILPGFESDLDDDVIIPGNDIEEDNDELSESDEEVEDNEEIIEDNTDNIIEDESSTQKRGRGRPRKTHLDIGPSPIEKRGRGRPRKTPLEDENVLPGLDSDDDSTLLPGFDDEVEDDDLVLPGNDDVETEDVPLPGFEDEEVEEDNIIPGDEIEDDDYSSLPGFEEDDETEEENNIILGDEIEDGDYSTLPGFEDDEEIEEDNILPDEKIEDDDSVLPGFDDDEVEENNILPDEEIEDDDSVLPGFDDDEVEENNILPDEEIEDDDSVLPDFDDDEVEENNILPDEEIEDDDSVLPGFDDDEVEEDNILPDEEIEEVDSTLPEYEDDTEEYTDEVNLPDLDDLDDVNDEILPGMDIETVDDGDDDIIPGLEYTSDDEYNNIEDNTDEESILPGMGFEDDSLNSDESTQYVDSNNNYNNMNSNNNYNNTGNNAIESIQSNVNYSMSSLNSLLTKEKKIVSFLGTTKNGTSFLINHLGLLFSSLGINTAILDMTKNKNSYYIYTKNEEELRKIAYTSISKLQNGYAEGIKANKNLTIYTALPNDGKDYSNAEPILSTLVQNYSLVLIDCDFETAPSYFASCQELYLVQSMDILTIQPLTAFLKELKTKGVLEPEKIRAVINKEIKVRGLTTKLIITGMSSYNDPSMSFMTELFNKDLVKACSIPFDENACSKYMENVAKGVDLTLNGYSKPFISKLKVLGDMVYPLTSKQTYGKKTGPVNQDYSANTFSSSMNNTLNQMRKKY